MILDGEADSVPLLVEALGGAAGLQDCIRCSGSGHLDFGTGGAGLLSAVVPVRGVTLAHLCAEAQKPLCLALVLDWAGDDLLRARDSHKASPLHRAFSRATPALAATVELLLRRGADPEERDKDGHSALHHLAYLASRPHSPPAEVVLDLLSTLIRAGASVNARDGRGWTPLHIAVEGRASEAVVQGLVARGADSSSPGIDNRTPVHIAQRMGSREILGILERGQQILAGGPAEHRGKGHPSSFEFEMPR